MIRKLAPIAAHLIFWSWNVVFLAILSFGLAPHVLGPLIVEVYEGFVPLDFALTSLALAGVPLLCTIVALMKLRTHPARLFALFYGVEAPIVVLLLLRLFLVRELTAATALVLGVMLVGGAVFAFGVFRAPSPGGRIAGVLSTVAHAMVLASGLYLGALILFYAVPAGMALLGYVGSFEWLPDLGRMLRHGSISAAVFGLMAFGLFLLSASLFVLMPPMVATLYVMRWRSAVAAASRAIGIPAAAVVTSLVLVGLGVSFGAANAQPQRAVLARLEQTPHTDAARRALLADVEQLREGLLNAYLAPYRYVAPVQSDHHIRDLYTRTVGLPESAADVVEGWYHTLAHPLLYDGDEASDGARSAIADERLRAANAYEAFFDAPIQQGERDAVLRALSATFDASGREAGLLDTGARKVLLERQELKVTEHGSYADVELYEVYANQTYEQQEVLYAFSLPDSAVITGLWLGDDHRRDRAFPFVLATRGAAQAVYKAEVRRRVDPALLEQVGPRQYRLRAFPIPPRLRSRVATTDRPTRMHLWMTLKVAPDDASWPMPRLIERRNVYSDRHTERTLNGGRMTLDEADAWLPQEVSATTPTARVAVSYTLTATAAVRAEPLDGPRPPLPPGRRFAVLLDRSYSMGRHVEALASAFDWLHDQIETEHHIDLYFSAGEGRGESPARIDQPRGFDPRDVVFFGGQDPGAMLRDFASLRGETRYDAVILLTDEGSYALAKDAPRPPEVGGPLWFVHVGGELPPGYDDGTLELIQSSGGGVTTALPRVFASLAYARTPGFIAVDDAYVWRSVPPGTEDHAPDGFAPLAARQHLAYATRQPAPLPLSTLDSLHTIAQQFSIVTPYSSMLVLVNDAQRAALAAAEAQDDRFDREVESGTEQLSTPLGGFPTVTATPEPEEWAMIALAAAALWVMASERRKRLPTAGC